MPVTVENYKKFEDALNRAKSDPNTDPARLNALEMQLNSFYESYSPVKPAGSGSPALAEQAQRSQEASKISPGSTLGGYAYEPTVDQFRSELSRPEVRSTLGLDEGSDTYASPEQMPNASNPDYINKLYGTNPSETTTVSRYSPESISQMGESSPEYKAYADRSFQEAQSKDPSLERAEDIDPWKSPFKYAGGQLLKLAPLAMNAARAASGYIPEIIATQQAKHPEFMTNSEFGVQSAMDPLSQDAQEQASKQVSAPIKNIEGVSPPMASTGSFIGSASPYSLESGVAGGLSKGLGYAKAGKLARGAIGAGTGTAGALASVALENEARNPSEDWADRINDYKTLLPMLAGGSALGEIVSQGAGALSRRSTTTAPYAPELRNLKRAGGGTSIPFGVHGTPEIRSNFDEAASAPNQDWPEAVAARRVASPIEESVDKQTRDRYKEIESQIAEYVDTPEARQPKSMKGVVKNILDMFKAGSFEGPVTGNIMHSNPSAVKTFGKVLKSTSEVAHMNPGEAALYAKHNNGFIIDSKTQKALDLPFEEGKVAVIVPAKKDARALLAFEDMIDDELKMASIPGGTNNPIWKSVNREVKSVRDQFGVSPKVFYDPGVPFAQANDIPGQPNVEGLSKPIPLDPPVKPEAIQGIGPDPVWTARDPGEPFNPSKDMPDQYAGMRNLGVPEGVGINLPKQDAIPGIGGPQKGKTATARNPAGMYAIQPDVPGQPRKHNERQTIPAGPRQEVPTSDDIISASNIPKKLSATANPNPTSDPTVLAPTELQPNESLNPNDPSFLRKASEENDRYMAGLNKYEEDNLTGLQSDTESLAPEAAASIPPSIRREPSPSEYGPATSDVGGAHPWESTVPEARQQIDEVNYSENIAAQKREAERLNRLRDEVGEVPINKTPEVRETWKDIRLTPSEMDARKKAGMEVAKHNAKTVKDEQFGERAKFEERRAKGQTPRKPDRRRHDDTLPAPPKESVKPQSDELFPEVPDQVGVPDKKKLAEEKYEVDVSKVKEIIAKTDELANDLTPEELDAVRDYTNKKGEKVGTPAWESATKKLTVDRPTKAGPLHSGTRLPQEKVNEILKSGTYSVTKPMSTSYNKGVASAMAYSRAGRGDVPVIFKINNIDSGVSLASKKLGVHGTTGEREVLLNNKDFDIVSSKRNKDGDLVIELKQKGKQYKATLDDGTEVHGLSALRHQQHEALSELEKIKQRTGSNNEESIYGRTVNYAKNPVNYYKDQELLNEANKLGLGNELRNVAGTRAFQALSNRANPTNMISLNPSGSRFDPIMMRLDPIFGALSNQQANPFAKPPTTIGGRIQQYMLQQLKNSANMQGGTGAARYGNEIAGELMPDDTERNY